MPRVSRNQRTGHQSKRHNDQFNVKSPLAPQYPQNGRTLSRWSGLKPEGAETVTARESVWVRRIRQKIVFERILLQAGKAGDQAHPELLEDIEQCMLDFFTENDESSPELLDESEYFKAKECKTASRLLQVIRWQEKKHQAGRQGVPRSPCIRISRGAPHKQRPQHFTVLRPLCLLYG